MLKPIDNLEYIKKNIEVIKRDYNWLNIIVSFLLLPLILAFLLSSFIDIQKTASMLKETISFVSIIVGFLINALVFILLNKRTDEPRTKENKPSLNKIELLKESLGYNILNVILFSLIFLILVLFYNFYPDLSFTIWKIVIHIVELLLLFLFFELTILLLNILRKFGVYIETKYPKPKK